MRITFTDVLGVDHQFAPVPATRVVPEWYKAMPEYWNGKREVVDTQITHTVKKCVPVWDALTAGYVIRTHVDIQVSERGGQAYYEWPSQNAIGFHPVEQAPNHPAVTAGVPYPKWHSPWAISTPRGYSCLFIPPMHNPNGIFTVMPGIVDTDTYTAPVNFPFTLDDQAWRGIIPAGTPMVQVIPFKRDDWAMRMGSDKDIQAQGRVTTRLRSVWFNSYKRHFWTRKQYR